MTKRFLLLLVPAVLFSLGCSTGKNAKLPSGMKDSMKAHRHSGERVVEYDLNQDSKPDVFSYVVNAQTADGKTVDRVVRKEFDINWDNRVDIVRFYGDNEQVEKEAYDLDFDGKIDQFNFFEKNVVVRKERDLNYDGKNDLWIYYEKGQIARKECDVNSDGKIDYWEYWEGDKIDRIGEDTDGDGEVDRWVKSAQPTES